MLSSRIPQVPSTVTGDIGRYLGLVVRQLNNEAYMSFFSGTSPESTQTGIPGNLAVNIGVTDTSRLWQMSGTTARQKRTGWTALGSGGAGSMSGARVNGTGTSNVSNSVVTMVRWNAEEYDTGAYHSTVASTTRITLPSAGYYHVFALLDFEANATGGRFIDIKLNGGSTVVAAHGALSAGAGDSTKVHCSADQHFAANDFIEVQAYQTSGGARTIDRSTSHFGATLIAAD